MKPLQRSGMLEVMRKALAVVISAVFAPVAVAAAGPADRHGQAQPTLKLASLQPVNVRGAQFRPGERVRVTASWRPTVHRTRVLRADKRGSILAQFADLPEERCSSLLAVAVGALGSRAQLKLPGPACPVR